MNNVTGINGRTVGGRNALHQRQRHLAYSKVVARSEAATDVHGNADRWQNITFFSKSGKGDNSDI